MKKNLLAFLTFATLMNSTVASADCLPLYREKIKGLENRMTGFKTTIITNMAAEGLLVAGLVATTGTVAVGGVLLLPAASVAAGSYLGVLAAKKAKYQKVVRLLKDAEKGSGKHLEKFAANFEEENGFISSKAQLSHALIESNRNKEFCTVDEYTEKVKLMGPKKVLKIISTRL